MGFEVIVLGVGDAFSDRYHAATFLLVSDGHYLAVENLLRDNRRMQQEMARAQMEKTAVEALRTITATFHHYINNSVATILGRAQLVEAKAGQSIGLDPDGSVGDSMRTIVGAVDTIGLVMDELKNLASFRTTVYHDDTFILDIETRLKERLHELKEKRPVS